MHRYRYSPHCKYLKHLIYSVLEVCRLIIFEKLHGNIPLFFHFNFLVGTLIKMVFFKNFFDKIC